MKVLKPTDDSDMEKLLEESTRNLEALENSEAQLRAIVKTATDGIISIDSGRCIIHWNTGAEKIFGYTEAEVVGRDILLIIPHNGRDAHRSAIDMALARGQLREPGITRETSGLKKDGTEVSIELTVSRWQTREGVFFTSIIRDITERKRTEAERDNSIKFRQALMDAIPSPVFYKDAECVYIGANKAFELYIGLSPEQFIGKTVYDIAPPDLAARYDKADRELLKSPAGVQSYEGSVVYSDGTHHDVIFNKARFFDTEGKLAGIVGLILDITERKKAEQGNTRLQAQLNQAQKMESIGILAGGIAHDFNNILVPIMGYTEMLSSEIPEESPLRESLNEIYSAAIRAKSLVNQILTFARQEQSELKLMKMQYIVKEALKLVRSTVPTTIEIKHDISNACGLIKADPTQIHQIVMNLATNAYHAMEETGGTMTISLKEVELDEQNAVRPGIKQGLYACLTVADTGVGIPEDIKERIFDPFFTTKAKGKGTGIGLSVVHGIVESSGGTIRVHSDIGKGTEFNIYLPVVESYFKKEDALQVKKHIQGGTERILIVDDEAVLITLQKGMLERLGYQITARTSSIEALEAFRAVPDKFDMVITDMAMPNMSGDKLAIELLKIRPDIPILICTGFSTIISEEKALSMGIRSFLMKPITITDLDRKIRDVLSTVLPK